MNSLNGSNGISPRITSDRRLRENGLPNGCDRRRSADRRLPKVEEDVVSEAEWFKYMAAFKLKLKARERVRIDKLQRLTSGSSH